MAEATDAPKPELHSITWESIRRALNCTRTNEGAIDYDKVRRERLAAVEAHTSRPAIVYATDFLNANKTAHAPAGLFQVNAADMQGLAEVTRGLDADAVDLILHSPGGSPEAAESIVSALRSQFKSVRVLVPVMAKSAATMITLAADEILMPLTAELGPIDPQFLLSDGRGGERMTPAQAIIDEVERARQAVKGQQADTIVWLSQVQGLPPGLYQQCLNAVALSKDLVGRWVEQYMLAGDANAKQIAAAIVNYLGDHNQFRSHGRRVDIATLAGKGAKVQDVRAVDGELWRRLEEFWYTVQHTFEGTGVIKMWESSRGVAFFTTMQIQAVAVKAPAKVN